MKRKIVKQERDWAARGSVYNIYYSNGDVEEVKLCCPHCKTRGGRSHSRDTYIRIDATRCPQCGGTFKEPEVISRTQWGYNWIEQEAKDQEYEDSLIFGFFEPLYFAVLCIILFLWFIVILMEL